MVDSAGCHPPALAAAATQVAVGHGARRRAQQHHPTSYPQPSSGYAVGRTRTRPPPCGSPIRRLGRWLDGAAGRGTAGSVAPLQAMYTSRVSMSRFAGRAVTVQLVRRVCVTSMDCSECVSCMPALGPLALRIRNTPLALRNSAGGVPLVKKRHVHASRQSCVMCRIVSMLQFRGSTFSLQRATATRELRAEVKLVTGTQLSEAGS